MNVLPSEEWKDVEEGDPDSNINILLQEQHQQPTTTTSTTTKKKGKKAAKVYAVHFAKYVMYLTCTIRV